MKKIHSVTQGSEQWHQLRAKYFTASECTAMMGFSKYQTRTQLLHAKSTGETKEVSQHQQKLFDKGHATEEAARVILEARLGDELYPATVTNSIEGLDLLASMDGMDMMEVVGFEHKLLNATLADAVDAKTIPDTHWPQLEHQMLVSGVDSIIFVVSDGTEENWHEMTYFSNKDRQKQIIEGWKQFAKDLAEYVPEVKAEVVEAEAIRDLPAITYKMDGLSLISNLDDFKAQANQLVDKANQLIETDQDFANAESRQKVFTKAEADIKALADRVLGEVADIDKFTKDLRYIGEQIRQARLAEGKQIKSRKEEIRKEILTSAENEIRAFRDTSFSKIKTNLPAPSISVEDAMKGKRTIDSLKDAADTAVAQIKVELNTLSLLAQNNILALKHFASDYKFLFGDWKDIAFKPTEDFEALVKTRVADHKVAEEERLNAEREKIRAEEKAKAEREAELKAQREVQAKQREIEAAKPKEVEPVEQSKLVGQPKNLNRSANTKQIRTFKVIAEWSGYSRGTAEFIVEAESEQEALDQYRECNVVARETIRDDTEYSDARIIKSQEAA
jgi:putative phage-type endonuclease